MQREYYENFPRVLMVPMHPGMQYHFARVGFPISILGNWEQFSYWRPKPPNVSNLLSVYKSEYLKFGLEDFRRLLNELPSYPEGFDIAWLHFPWQIKLFWNDFSLRKIYFAAKEDELSLLEWDALLSRSDFEVASYYRHTTEWVKEKFGVTLKEIQLGISPDDYCDWTGENLSILTVIHSWKNRGWHYYDYLHATEGLPTLHVDHLDKSKTLVSYIDLINLFRSSRLYLHDGEREYTITLIEAMMTGMPIVSFDLPGIEDYVKHGINGFVGRTPMEIREYCRMILYDPILAESFGKASRQIALANHNELRWKSDWKHMIGTI